MKEMSLYFLSQTDKCVLFYKHTLTICECQAIQELRQPLLPRNYPSVQAP